MAKLVDKAYYAKRTCTLSGWEWGQGDREGVAIINIMYNRR